MHRIGRTFVRLSSENRLRLDRLRRHHDYSRDRLVNEIVADYLDRIYTDILSEHALHHRRAA